MTLNLKELLESVNITDLTVPTLLNTIRQKTSNLMKEEEVVLKADGVDIDKYAYFVYALQQFYTVQLPLKERLSMQRRVIEVKVRIQTITQEGLVLIAEELESRGLENTPIIFDMEDITVTGEEDAILQAFVKGKQIHLVNYISETTSKIITYGNLMRELELDDKNILHADALRKIKEKFLTEGITFLDVNYLSNTSIKIKFFLAILPVITNYRVKLYALNEADINSVNKIYYLAYLKENFFSEERLANFFSKEIKPNNVIIHIKHSGNYHASNLVYVDKVEGNRIEGRRILFENGYFFEKKTYVIYLAELTTERTITKDNENYIYPIEFNSQVDELERELREYDIRFEKQVRKITYKDIAFTYNSLLKGKVVSWI